MFHPFQIKKYLIAYLCGFVFFLVISLGANYFRYGGFSINIVYSIFHLLVTFFLGSGIWFTIKYKPTNMPFLQIAISQCAACAVFVMLTIFFDEIFKSFVYTLIEYRLQTPPWLLMISSIIILYVIFSLYFYVLLTMFDNEKKTKNEEYLHELLRESELNALKSQINPHFLFNSLNSISSLTITDAERAQEMLIKLSDYLRYSLKQKDNRLVAFSEELSNCQHYLEIEKIRFGEKLVNTFDIDSECYSCMMPVLILQPLFENAVKHGVYESLKPIKIQTKAWLEQNIMVIQIVNDFDADATPRKGEGIGLENVKKRLDLTYGGEAKLQIEKKQNEFWVILRIPIEKNNS